MKITFVTRLGISTQKKFNGYIALKRRKNKQVKFN